MNLQERRTADRALAEDRRAARRDYIRHAEEAAKADAEYRKTKAKSFLAHRHDGESVEAAKIQADAESADPRMRRDIAHSLARAALLRVEETERDAVSVRDISSMSERIDGAAA